MRGKIKAVSSSEVVSAARQVAGAKFICWQSSIRDEQRTASFTCRRECSLCKVCALHAHDGAVPRNAVSVERPRACRAASTMAPKGWPRAWLYHRACFGRRRAGSPLSPCSPPPFGFRSTIAPWPCPAMQWSSLGPRACRVAQAVVISEPIGVMVGSVGAGLVSFPTKVAKNLLCFS